MKVGVVILNYASSEFVRAAVESVLRTGYQDITLYVVDNYSSDLEVRSIQKLGALDGRVQIILSQSNVGFSHGSNQGIRKAIDDGCEFIHICNPDVKVSKNFYQCVLNFFLEKSNCMATTGIGFLGADQKDESQIWYNGGFFSMFRGRADCIDKFKSVSEVDISKTPFQTQFISCACLVVRKEFFEQHGCLDEDYCLGGEEWQLSKDIQRHGGELWVCPSTSFHHVVSVTHEKYSARLLYIGIRTKLLFSRKNLENFQYIAWVLMYVLGFIAILLRHCLKTKQWDRRMVTTAVSAFVDHFTGRHLTIEIASRFC